eukprot:g7620.t1
MVNPVCIAFCLVESIITRLQAVKINREGCQLLAHLAKQTVRILAQFDKQHQFESTSMKTALELITDALREARDAVDKCCNASFLSAVLYHENYAFSLKAAAAKLEHSLTQISLVSIQTTVDIRTSIHTLSNQLRHAKFEEHAAMNKQTQALKGALEKAYFRTHKETREVKKLIKELIGNQRSSRELKTELEMLKREASAALKNKEKQMEFELNEIMAAISESLKDSSTQQVHNQIESPRCNLAPTSTIRDSMLLNETTTTHTSYDSPKSRELREDTQIYVVEEQCTNLGMNSINVHDPLTAVQGRGLGSIGESRTLSLNSQYINEKSGWTSLHKAAQYNRIDDAKELIMNGMDIDIQDTNGLTPLYIASHKNSIEELIARGASIDLRERHGASPLHVVAKKNYIEVAKELINNGANVDLKKDGGLTPLHIAVQHNSINVAKLLINKGANMDLQNKDGMSPLHIAASNGRVNLIKILLKQGASKMAKNNKGKTPFDVVCCDESLRCNDEDIIRKLKSLLKI